MTAILRALLAGMLLLPATLFVDAPNATAATHAITIANFAFAPASTTVTAGDTVTWTNTDQAPHDVTVTNGPTALHSPTITTGQSWTHTFTTPGTYAYICSIHPDMHATLVVTPLPAAPPPTHAAVPAPPVRQPAARTTPPPTRIAQPTSTSTTTPPTSTPPAASATSSTGGQSTGLNPLLLVAGLVAGVATLCLLMIGSRPEPDQENK